MFVAPGRWIDLASDVTYQTMRDFGCPRNSCVEAACIAVGVAQEFGYLCEPVPLAVLVQAGKQATILPGSESRRTDGFAGHLVVYYPGAGTMVDLTADQFHAPKRGLLLMPEPLVFPVEREGLTGGFEADLPTGTMIRYREMAGDVSWRALPAWTQSSAGTIAMVVRRIRSAMAKMEPV